MKHSVTPETAPGNQEAARYGNKKALAVLLCLSLRSIDNLVARGCPHLKLSARLVRFDFAEVKAWLAAEYGTRRAK